MKRSLDLQNYTDSQREAVVSMGKDLLISAGAGTGKTRVLVGRFAWLVLEGHAGVEDILAVTFTEKAADEMKRRISGIFRDLGMHAERRAVENAHISTIHGFCARVLLENPFEAGIDPEFSVMSDNDRAVMMNHAWEALLQQGDEAVMDLIEDIGPQETKEAIRRYIDLNRALGRPVSAIGDILARPQLLMEQISSELAKQTQRVQDELIEMAKGLKELRIETKVEDLRTGVLDILGRLKAGYPDPAALSEISGLLKGKRLNGPKNPSPDDVEAGRILGGIRDKLKGCQKLTQFDKEEEEALIETKVLPFLRAASFIWTEYGNQKEREGVLDFDDLQFLTKELLASNANVRDECRRKFKHVLIDEFQDVNNLQKELFEILKPPGGFFIVGDTRQSIYGFRDADVNIMRGYRDKCDGETSALVSLDDNFRSGSGIIDFINGLFAEIWKDKPEQQPLICKREEFGACTPVPHIEIIICTDDGDEEDERERLDMEAEAVAGRVAELLQQEFLVNDPRERKLRPVRYSDIALLFRSRSAYPNYSREFSTRGIPFTMQQSRNYYEQMEVRDAINFLRVIDNARQDLQVAAVLRSPFFEISDDAFVFIRKFAECEGIRGQYIVQSVRGILGKGILDESDERKCREFIELLDTLRKLNGHVPPADLYDMILDKTRYRAKTITLWGGERKAANIQKFRELLDDFASRHTGGLRGFLDYYENLRAWGVPEEEAEQITGEENVVRFLTIHGAKGLEFPVVILPNTGAGLGGGPKPKVLVSPTLEAGFPLDDENSGASLRKELIASSIKEAEAEEEQRLLYVAMTRARDHLIIAGSPTTKTFSSPEHSYLSMAAHHLDGETSLLDLPDSSIVTLGGTEILVRRNPVYDVVTSKLPAPFVRKARKYIEQGKQIPEKVAGDSDPDVVEDVERAIDFVRRAESLEVPKTPARLSATDLVLYDECPMKYYLRKVLGLPEASYDTGRFYETFSSDDIRGAELGNLVHGCLEQIDFARPAQQEIEKALSVQSVDDEVKERIRSLLSRFLESELAGEIRNARKVEREVSFTLYSGGIPIHDRVDLLHTLNDGTWRIVDYKTNNVSAEKVDDAACRYKLQMELYGLTLSRVDNMPASEAVAWFLVPGVGKTFTFSAEILSECSRRVEDIVEKIKAASFEPKDRDKCSRCIDYEPYCRQLIGTV